MTLALSLPEISLREPLFLLALLILPLGFVLHRIAMRRRRRYAVRFPALGTLASLIQRPPAWRRRLPVLLLALSVCALAVALARPERTVAVPVEQASVMLVTDASGSMEATDVQPDRLTAATDAAASFLDRVPSTTRVGIVAYSTSPHTTQAPTTDRDVIRATLDSLSADGGTATGDALASALQALGRNPDATERPEGRQPPAAIVLLSDGKAMGGRDPEDVARVAGELGVPIYTVSLGTPDGVVQSPYGDPIPVPPDPQSLRQIARESGGEFFRVEDGDRLNAVYERLGSRLGTKPRKKEATAGFAGAGLALLALGGFLGARWRGKLT
jgi:Ca-activated chloride channel homolog